MLNFQICSILTSPPKNPEFIRLMTCQIRSQIARKTLSNQGKNAGIILLFKF